MKRLLPAALFVCLLASPSNAGETTGPGAVASPTPLCLENCTNAAPVPGEPLGVEVAVGLVFSILLIGLRIRG